MIRNRNKNDPSCVSHKLSNDSLQYSEKLWIYICLLQFSKTVIKKKGTKLGQILQNNIPALQKPNNTLLSLTRQHQLHLYELH